MTGKEGKVFEPSHEVGQAYCQVYDPYQAFLNKRPRVQPVRGKAFYARLVAITPTEFVFEGDFGMLSVYAKGQIRCMILDEDTRGRAR